MTSDAPRVGSVLGDRYELVVHLSTTELTDVYEAEDQVLHRRVAVRVSRATTAADRARFDEEARTLARVNEPGIATVYDAGQHGEAAFVVVQLLAGAADEPTAPTAVVEPDPTGEVTRVIDVGDHTRVLPAVAPILPGTPVAARSRHVPVWGMVAGLAVVLAAILVFAATRGPGADEAPTVAPTSTSVTTVVRRQVPVTTAPTATTAPTTSEAPTSTTVEPTTTTVTLLPLPGDQGDQG